MAAGSIDGTSVITLELGLKVIGLCGLGVGFVIGVIGVVFKMLHKDLKVTLVELLKSIQVLVLDIGGIKKDIESIKNEQHEMKQDHKELKILVDSHEKKITKIRKITKNKKPPLYSD